MPGRAGHSANDQSNGWTGPPDSWMPVSRLWPKDQIQLKLLCSNLSARRFHICTYLETKSLLNIVLRHLVKVKSSYFHVHKDVSMFRSCATVTVHVAIAETRKVRKRTQPIMDRVSTVWFSQRKLSDCLSWWLHLNQGTSRRSLSFQTGAKVEHEKLPPKHPVIPHGAGSCPTITFSIQLPANSPENAAEDGSSAWDSAPLAETPKKNLSRGFGLAQLWPLCPSGKWTNGYKLSFSPFLPLSVTLVFK